MINASFRLILHAQATRLSCPPAMAVQSPNELQDLLDATRLLLDELEAKQRTAVDSGSVPQPDPDTDELREKFRIMKASRGGCDGAGWRGRTLFEHSVAALGCWPNMHAAPQVVRFFLIFDLFFFFRLK